MSLNTNLSKNLNAIRRSRSLSISDFAQELCIARSSLQNILNGTCNLRMDTINHIASSLDTDSLTLLKDQYSSDQYAIAMVTLDALEAFQKLSYEDRAEASGLFHRLIMLLDKGAGL
jgi:transcriptional regulator with XRE-family HTH domain